MEALSPSICALVPSSFGFSRHSSRSSLLAILHRQFLPLHWIIPIKLQINFFFAYLRKQKADEKITTKLSWHHFPLQLPPFFLCFLSQQYSWGEFSVLAVSVSSHSMLLYLLQSVLLFSWTTKIVLSRLAVTSALLNSRVDSQSSSYLIQPVAPSSSQHFLHLAQDRQMLLDSLPPFGPLVLNLFCCVYLCSFSVECFQSQDLDFFSLCTHFSGDGPWSQGFIWPISWHP